MAKKKPTRRRSKAPAKYRIRETVTTYGPDGRPAADGRGLQQTITRYIEPADPDDPEAIGFEEVLRRTTEHPLDVLERMARRDLEAAGFEPPASFLDDTPPESRTKLGR